MRSPQLDWSVLESDDPWDADDTIDTLVAAPASPAVLRQLHMLITHPGHRAHQRVVRRVQELADPSSVEPLRGALAAGFEVYAYTCSEDGVIAKWFSWALAQIGTPQAVAVLKEFAASPNKEVADEMRYRLAKR